MGQRDQLVPAEAGAELVERLPDGRLKVFERAGHAPFFPIRGNLSPNCGLFSMRDNESAVFELDRRALRWAFERAAVSYDQAAVAQREVGQRLLERLDQIKLDPAVILDMGCATGATTALLFKKYRRARIVGLERAVGMVAVARKRAPWLRTLYGAVGEPEALPLADASCDLIFPIWPCRGVLIWIGLFRNSDGCSSRAALCCSARWGRTPCSSCAARGTAPTVIRACTLFWICTMSVMPCCEPV